MCGRRCKRNEVSDEIVFARALLDERGVNHQLVSVNAAVHRVAGLMTRTRQLGIAVAVVAIIAGCFEPQDPTAGTNESGEAPSTAESSEVLEPVEVGALEAVNDDPLGDHMGDRYTASLDAVLERRFLRVLTSKNSFDYFIHQGHHGGYQYELVKAFTEHLNRKYHKSSTELPIQFELMPVSDDQLIPMLLQGAADMIAARLTITAERSALILFSNPYRTVDEVVVTHRKTAGLRPIHDLSGHNVAVRKSTSYYASLLVLNRELAELGRPPVVIHLVDEQLETEKLLELVAAEHFDYTVADSIVAEIAVAIMPELRILQGLELRTDGQLAWATHLTASDLAAEMNDFLTEYEHGSLLGNLVTQKYFEKNRSLKARMATGSDEPLSAYDDFVKLHAEAYGFDWRLMAAMAYQESRFDQNARNRSGAVGLFQIKPMTAREPYIDIPDIAGPENAGNNIQAGIKYLNWIKTRYFDAIAEMRERDRVRMALAAYNAGPRTLINARNRAEQMGLDPMRWFRNVELALLAMRKPEPVKYVSEINQRYLSYIMLDVK
jgi:membrane-bound lytic murein transglycosylase MltF